MNFKFVDISCRIAENVGWRKFWRIQLFRLLGEETLVNSPFQINTEIKGSIKLREKTLAIGRQFANVFSHQHFPLYSICVIKMLKKANTPFDKTIHKNTIMLW